MKILNPAVFQGSLRKKQYFEGWYFKTAGDNGTIAVIPGISKGKDSHAFIQIIIGRINYTGYIRYPLSDFHFSRNRLDIQIGGNRFSEKGYRLQIKYENLSIAGEVSFGERSPFPRKFLAPGIMGPFSFVPFMECYHGIVSADHSAKGELKLNERRILIKNARGYIEKDWGRSMPSSWIWLQTNYFEQQGVSLMLSIARIPWLGSSFTGLLAFIYINNKYHVFATYNGSSYTIENRSPDIMKIRLENRKYRLEIDIPEIREGGSLQAPVNGELVRSISEKNDEEIKAVFSDQDGSILFSGTGRYCGIEIVGDTGELVS